MKAMEKIIVDAIANLHNHSREGDVVEDLVHHSIEGGADVILTMPNVLGGITTAEQVLSYNSDVKSTGIRTIPTVMLTEQTTEAMIIKCVENGIRDGKLYPYERTTNSEKGIRSLIKIFQVVKWAGMHGMKVHVHPEHPNLMFSNRDAEYMYVPWVCELLEQTEATIIWEHGTDARCIPHWKEFAKTGRFYVTLTAHHLASNEDELYGDVRGVCKPPPKAPCDQTGLISLVEEDHSWVMAGADDAPHDFEKKHVNTGRCACGAYTSPFLLQLYAHALSRLLQTPEGVAIFNNFISRNARKLHNLPPASKFFELTRGKFVIPKSYKAGDWIVEPFWAGWKLDWNFKQC